MNPPSPANRDFGEPIYDAKLRGNITTLGNTVLTCSETFDNAATGGFTAAQWADGCNRARTNGESNGIIPMTNNGLPMENIEVVAGPLNSSQSMLTIPAGSTIMWAGLHWNGMIDPFYQGNYYPGAGPGATTDPPPDVNRRFEMSLGAPGQPLVNVTADDTWDLTNAAGDVTYAGYADVTDIVAAAGAGLYTGGDVQTCTGFGGCMGSWSMTVAYAHPDEPARTVAAWHGWNVVAPGVNDGVEEFTLDGLRLPPAGAINVEMGLVAADGDRGQEDTIEVRSPSSGGWVEVPRQIPGAWNYNGEEYFGSWIDYFGDQPVTNNPYYASNLNIDIGLSEDDTVLSNEDTSLDFRIRTTQLENIFPQVVHLSVPIDPPGVTIDKNVDTSATPLGGTVAWTLDVDNDSPAVTNNAVVTDELPAGVEYVPGTIEYVSGPNAGAKTDTAGDDQADYDAATRTFTFRIGTGADAATGGTLAPGPDSSDRTVITFDTTYTDETYATVTNTAVVTGEGDALEDPFGPITVTDEDDEPVTGSPLPLLGITKITDEAAVLTPGSEHAYTVRVTNTGPGTEPAAVVTDVLREGLEFVSATDGGTYDEATRTVTWALGALGPDAEVDVGLVVRVARPAPDSLLDESGRIPNTASVTGELDCVPDETEDERCESTVTNPPGQPQLTQDKVVDRAEAIPGDELTYTVTVANDGTAPATDVVAVDELPGEVTFDDAAADKGDVVDNGDGSLTWSIGSLDVGEVVTMTVTATVDEGVVDTAFVNRVRITHDGDDCFTDCEVIVENECEDDPTWSCAPTRTPGPDDPPPALVSPPSPPKTPAPPKRSGPLPVTGAPVAGLALLGAALLGGGGAIHAIRRRMGSGTA